MSELTDKVSAKVKEQWEQLGGSAEQLSKAGRGLVMKVSKEAEKQFGQLVETGETQKEQGKTIAEQLKGAFDGQFDDAKGSVDQVKLATLGLFTKMRESGEKAFKELVELGEGRQSQGGHQGSKGAAA